MPADAATARSSRVSIVVAALCTLAVAAAILGVRWAGPHDLFEKDQPKTMAYTADIVLHGRFSMPRDVIYQPATKPPMYNWIDAAAVRATGSWSEWTLKLPSTLGVLATTLIVFAAARRALLRDALLTDRTTAGRAGVEAVVVGLIAAGIWLTFGSDVRHGSVMRLAYLARPDMLLTAFCTAAWACFTVAVDRRSARDAVVLALAAWACVTAAALTKGPAAALPIVFAAAYAIPHPRRLWNLWLPVGLPVLVVGVGGWLYLAARQDPVHVRQVIWGAEVAGRLTETPEGFRKPFYYTVMWFVTKALPWGTLALLALAATAGLPRLRRSAGPAALYLAIVLVGLSLPAAKRMDYLLPAFAPAAVLIAVVLADVVRGRVLGAFGLLGVIAAVGLTLATNPHKPAAWLVPAAVVAGTTACLWVERRRPVPLAAVAVLPLLLAVTQARAYRTKFFEVENRWSDHAVDFVRDVRRQVKPSEGLLVIVRGKHPLTTLLGRHPGSYLTPKDFAAAEFVILPEQPDLKPLALSAPLPEGFAELEHRPLVRLGLYRGVPVDRLVAAQRACGEWSVVENPYHAPGTVFREN